MERQPFYFTLNLPVKVYTQRTYTAKGVNYYILIANTKPHIPSLKFQNFAFRAC